MNPSRVNPFLVSGLVSGLVLGVALVGATAHAKGPEIFPLSKIRRGQKGVALTVFQGTKPEKFEIEVIGVLKHALPKQDLILVRSDDPKLLAVGFAQGMSGSPIYIEGKVACAFSYAFPFARAGNIGGCTPIEEMIADAKRPRRGPEKAALASAEDWRRVAPLERALALGGIGRVEAWLTSGPLPPRPTAPRGELPGLGSMRASLPLSIAGLGPWGMGMVRTLFAPYGLEVAQGLSGGDTEVGPKAFEMGAAIGALMATGDVSMAATGTVSYIDGNVVSAFGHPFFQMGEIYMPATAAEVHVIVPSTNISFKIASPLRVLGSLVQDRQASIVIDTSRKLEMIPVTVTIRSPAGEETLAGKVLRNRFLTHSLVGVIAGDAGKTLVPDAAEATITVDSTITLRGFEPLKFRDYFYSADGASDAVLGARGLRVLAPLLFNPFAPVSIDKIDVTVDVKYGSEHLELLGVRAPDGAVVPGRTVPITVIMRKYGGGETTETIPITIPRELAGQLVRVEIAPGDTVRPDVAPPESLDDLVRALRKFLPSNTLVATIYSPDEGVTLGGKILPDLPDSALDTARPSTTTRRGESYKSFARVVVPTTRVVLGRAELMLKIQDDRP